ncbi:DedA family protein [Streptomyces sp. NPDC091972]|uniref:DedA family protein n=1 Tax=Streptomyces sp. NPDC091972 TaxID=3366007 RepID=UPI0037FB5371
MFTAVHLSSQLAGNVLDVHSLLAACGVVGAGAVLFTETGLLIGFFRPGVSLLFTAGLLSAGSTAADVHLSLGPLLVAAAGVLAGVQCGYLLGRKEGGALLARGCSQRLHGGARRAGELLERLGYAKAIVLARFVPVVRTVLSPMAGALRVPVRTFTLWRAVDGLVWSTGLTLAGYALGASIPNVDRNLLPLVALIVVVSLIPLLAEVHTSRPGAEAEGTSR